MSGFHRYKAGLWAYFHYFLFIRNNVKSKSINKQTQAQPGRNCTYGCPVYNNTTFKHQAVNKACTI